MPRALQHGVAFIAPRGTRPPAQNIAWSPVDPGVVLVEASETPFEPAEIFLLDVVTGHKTLLVGPLTGAQFIEVKWMPDGKEILVNAVDTIGFEPSGWWSINIDDKTAERLLSAPLDEVAWSPDGRYLVTVQRTPEYESRTTEVKLIDAQSKTELSVAKYSNVDYSAGISWAADSHGVVFTLGRYQEPSSLFLLDVDTKTVSTVLERHSVVQPSWSPEGSIIAYEDEFRLYLTDPEGSCEIEIPLSERAWSPSWSPDGTRLGYIGSDGIYYLEIATVLGRDVYQGLCV